MSLLRPATGGHARLYYAHQLSLPGGCQDFLSLPILARHNPFWRDPVTTVTAAGAAGYADPVTVRAPAAVRAAGVIVVLQGSAGLAVAAALVLRRLGGVDERAVDGVGTGLWFLLCGGAVLAAGWALLVGKRWGRGLAVFAQLLLLPVAWYLAVGSAQLALGLGVGAVALTTLVLLFSPPALRWVGADDARP